MTTGWYEVSKSKNGWQFHFVLKAGNGEVILSSEMYNSKQAALNGISSVQVNSTYDRNYYRDSSRANQPYFNLKAANREIIGTSQMYSSSSACEAGIASVKKNGPSSTIKDLTSAGLSSFDA